MLGVCLLVWMPAPAHAQDMPDAPLRTLGTLVDALRDEDTAVLAALVDWPAHTAEGRFRGTLLQNWDSLDATNQFELMQQTIEDWLDAGGSFVRSALLFGFRAVDDPDAGRGPVPDRVVLQGVLRSPRDGLMCDLLLFSTREGRVLDVVLGETYPEGANPAGPAGLLPTPVPQEDDLAVHWPSDVDRHERAAAEELVEQLCHGESRRDRALATESLHRSPQAGATALIQRLIELEQQGSPDTALQSTLVEALEAITGRTTGFLANPRYGMDEGSWRAGNHAEVLAWARWHGRHGGSFVSAPVVDPIEPTHKERPPRSGPHDSAAGGEPTHDAGSHASGSGPALVSPPAGSDTGGDTGGAAGADSAPGTPGMLGAPAAPPATPVMPDDPIVPAAPTSGTPATDRPKVVLRDPPPPPLPGGAPPADDLPLLGVPPEGAGPAERHPLGEVKSRLDGQLVATLESWAPVIRDLGLSAAATGHPAHVVLGWASDDQLASACHVLDAAYPIAAACLPGSQQRPVVTILFDRETSRGANWDRLLTELVARGVIRADAESGLRADPRGFTARSQGVFVQPVWDMTGEGEFQFPNEVAHKFTQVLAVERAGPLPDWLLWGLGHLVEIRLFDTAYQFSTDGFVATADHFDWPRSAADALAKRAKRRSFSLVDRMLEASQASTSLENPMIAWGTLEYLYAQRPNDLRALVEDLAQLHRVQTPRGDSPDYLGDPTRTRAALEWRLASVQPDELIAYLESLR